MSDLIFITALLLLSGVSGQDFHLLATEMELSSCQPEHKIRDMRSDIECLVRAASSTAQVAKYDAISGSCSTISRCDLLNLSSSGVALRPSSMKVFEQPVKKLLFAVKSGSGVQSNTSYAWSTGCNNSLMLLPHGQVPSLHLWRSCWLDRLPELVQRFGFSQIVMHVVKAGADVMNVTFRLSGTGLDMWNWFSKDNVLSYWPAALDIPAKTFNFFSIQGYHNENSGLVDARSFYINLLFNGCSGDIGHFAIMDSQDSCPYGSNVASPLPKILYNLDSSKTWTQSIHLADYMLIEVQ